ncbi:MAG: TatD family hydrolase, partial [Collinsella sp.]
YFSVNERMLATKRGREYVRQIPLDRLLLETDAPAEANAETSAQSLIRSLTRTSERIASLKNCDAKHIESAVLGNSRSVFGLR